MLFSYFVFILCFLCCFSSVVMTTIIHEYIDIIEKVI